MTKRMLYQIVDGVKTGPVSTPGAPRVPSQ